MSHGVLGVFFWSMDGLSLQYQEEKSLWWVEICSMCNSFVEEEAALSFLGEMFDWTRRRRGRISRAVSLNKIPVVSSRERTPCRLIRSSLDYEI